MQVSKAKISIFLALLFLRATCEVVSSGDDGVELDCDKILEDDRKRGEELKKQVALEKERDKEKKTKDTSSNDVNYRASGKSIDLTEQPLETVIATCRSHSFKVKTYIDDNFLLGADIDSNRISDVTYIVAIIPMVFTREFLVYDGATYTRVDNNCDMKIVERRVVGASLYKMAFPHRIKGCSEGIIDFEWVDKLKSNRPALFPGQASSWFLKIEPARLEFIASSWGKVFTDSTTSTEHLSCVRKTNFKIYELPTFDRETKETIHMFDGYIFMMFVEKELMLEKLNEPLQLSPSLAVVYTERKINNVFIVFNGAELNWEDKTDFFNGVICDETRPCFYTKEGEFVFAFREKVIGSSIRANIFRPLALTLGFEGEFLQDFVDTLTSYFEKEIVNFKNKRQKRIGKSLETSFIAGSNFFPFKYISNFAEESEINRKDENNVHRRVLVEMIKRLKKSNVFDDASKKLLIFDLDSFLNPSAKEISEDSELDLSALYDNKIEEKAQNNSLIFFVVSLAGVCLLMGSIFLYKTYFFRP
mgnify:CR=1 FL=1